MQKAPAGTGGGLLAGRGPAVLVGRGGVEPPTFHFSGGRSYQLSYLPKRRKPYPRARPATKTGRGRILAGVAARPYAVGAVRPPSSSGLGRRPFTAVARVRIPLGVLLRSLPGNATGAGRSKVCRAAARWLRK